MTIRPFLLLSSRADDDVAHLEHSAVARLMGLAADDVRHLRVEQAPVSPVDLTEFSGVLLGGSPFNYSDAEKSPLQVRVEADIAGIVRQVIRDDVPFLGLCYGVGALTSALGGTVDTSYPEPVGAVRITLTEEGRADPLLATGPVAFDAFVGHKECCPSLPEGAVLLATSDACPVQAFRVGRHVYATQFHPELDHDGLTARVHAYRHHGYFPPETAESILETAATVNVSAAHGMLTAFARRYARP